MTGEMVHPNHQTIIGACEPVCERSRDCDRAFLIRTRRSTMLCSATPSFTMSNNRASASRAKDGARPLAGRRRIILHNHRAALDNGEGFAEALDPRPNPGGRAEVEDHDVVPHMVDNLAEREFQLDAPAPAQSALEDRELQPFAVPVH